MTFNRYALTDRLLIELHTQSPYTTYARLTGYPDESDWRIISGTAHIEDGVLVLDDESPGLHIRRADDEAEAFLANFRELDPWNETATWRWASDTTS